MSVLSIAEYFHFRRIKIVNQTASPQAAQTHIHARPDKRFQPVCHEFRRKASGIHSWTQAQDSGFEPFPRPDVAHLSVSQSVLCTLPWNSYRGVGVVSSVPSGNSFPIARYIYHLCRFMTKHGMILPIENLLH